MKILLLLFIVIHIMFSCSPEQQGFDLVISNVNLVDVKKGAIRNGVSVLINDSKIIEIIDGPSKDGKEVIDGTGQFLMPGLFDCHVHTTDFEIDFPPMIHYGVTSVFVPGGSTCTDEYYKRMREAGNQDTFPAPRVFHTSQHFTMEGRHPVKTYASSNWREGKTVFYLRDTTQIADLVSRVSNYPILGIKLTIEDGPAPPFVPRMPQHFINKTVKEAKKYDLEVYAHVSDVVEYLMAIEGGVQNIIHFIGVDVDWENQAHVKATQELKKIEGSIITTLMIDKSFIYPLYPEWINDPFLHEAYPEEYLESILTPEKFEFAEYMAQIIKRDLDLDEIRLDNLYYTQIEDLKRIMELDINIALGTDAGNTFNFHGYSLHEEMEIFEIGGIETSEVLKMATINAAKMMKADQSLGSLEPGKYADMILLRKNPLETIYNVREISSVFKNGKEQLRFPEN